MNREIADLLPPLDPAPPSATRIAAIQDAMSAQWKPVRVISSAGAQVALLWGLYAAVAVAVAALIGFSGIHAMRGWQILTYDGAFSGLAVLAAAIAVQRLNPGMRALMPGTTTLWLSGVLLGAIALILFPDFSIRFFAKGVSCLETGCAVTALVSLLFAFALRRTFASSPVSAGAAVGFLAGLCGATALALHCPVLTTPHILVWHLSVLLISSGVGAFGGAAIGFVGARRTNRMHGAL